MVVVQKEVQESVTELDRARFVYYTEESECIKTVERAEEAQLIAQGKKKAMMSMFSVRKIHFKDYTKPCNVPHRKIQGLKDWFNL